jgi:hypothetical protein
MQKKKYFNQYFYAQLQTGLMVLVYKNSLALLVYIISKYTYLP